MKLKCSGCIFADILRVYTIKLCMFRLFIFIFNQNTASLPPRIAGDYCIPFILHTIYKETSLQKQFLLKSVKTCIQ